MDKNQNPHGAKEGFSVALLIAALAWALHLVPLLFPNARLWGFNHLLFLPRFVLYLYLAGGIISLLMFFAPLRASAQQVYDKIADGLFKRRFIFRWWILAAVSLVIFWLGRPSVFLLGDSYSVAANIGNELPVIYKWSEIGSIYLAYFVSRLFPFAGNDLARYAYGLIGVVSGAVTILLFLAISYVLGKGKAERLIIFAFSVFAGWLVLFFGYIENYSALWPLMTGYIYFSIRYLNHKGGLLAPTVFVLLALILHLQVLFFLISYPVLIFSRGRRAEFYQVHRKLIWAGAVLILIVGCALFIRLYNASLELRTYLMPFINGRPASPDYTLFSPAHLLDVINQLLILTPILPALIILGWRGWRSIAQNRIDFFLMLLSFGGIVFLLTIEPKLGMGRDWDLFALSGLAPMLLLSKNMAASARISKSLFPALALVSLVMVFPFVAVNMSYQPAIDNYRFLLNLDLPKSRTGLTILRDMYSTKGDSAAADSIQQVMIEAFPAIHQAPRAFLLSEQGKFEEALILIDSMARVDPYSVELYNLRGRIYFKQGRYARAIQDLEIAASMGRYDSRILVQLGRAYGELNQHDRMMEYFRKAQDRNPNSASVIEGFAMGFFAMNIPDSAYVYAQRLVKSSPNNPRGFLIAGLTANSLGDDISAQVYLTGFLELAPDDPGREMVEQILRSLEQGD